MINLFESIDKVSKVLSDDKLDDKEKLNQIEEIVNEHKKVFNEIQEERRRP